MKLLVYAVSARDRPVTVYVYAESSKSAKNVALAALNRLKKDANMLVTSEVTDLKRLIAQRFATEGLRGYLYSGDHFNPFIPEDVIAEDSTFVPYKAREFKIATLLDE